MTTNTPQQDTSPDPAKAGKLAQQIVTVLANEDSIMRQRAVQAAMMLLGEAASPQISSQSHSGDGDVGSHNHSDLAAFFNREEGMKPADNAQLCAAYHYSVYGASAFSIAELKAIATDAGVVLPNRVDMTLRSALQKGKKLFQPAGSSVFKPTAAGCLHFAEKWKVKPGKKTKPAAAKAGLDAETR
jgi:hypothetical protein